MVIDLSLYEVSDQKKCFRELSRKHFNQLPVFDCSVSLSVEFQRQITGPLPLFDQQQTSFAFFSF